MQKVYLLQHLYQYGKNEEYEEIKLLGIFSSRVAAEKAIDYYKTLPGFCDYSNECFIIDTYELNKHYWTEGFMSK